MAQGYNFQDDSYDKMGNPVSKYFEINGIVLGITRRTDILSRGAKFIDSLEGFEMPDGICCNSPIFGDQTYITSVTLNSFPTRIEIPDFYKSIGLSWMPSNDTSQATIDHWAKKMKYRLESLGFHEKDSQFWDYFVESIWCEKYQKNLEITISYYEWFEIACS